MFRVAPGRPDPEVIEQTCAALRRGDLVLVPTETVYGIAGLASGPGIVARIARAKGRPESRPIALLASGRPAVEAYGARFGPRARRLADAFWPGPLTLVLETPSGCEGFRVPDHPVPVALAAAAGLLRATSANRAGESPALTADRALAALGRDVAVCLDAGPAAGGVASTVVKVTENGVIVLREGAIPAARVRAVAA